MGSRQEKNQETILRFSVRQQAHLRPRPRRESSLTHVPALQVIRMLQREFQHILTQASFFIKKRKKNLPAVNRQLSTQRAELLGNSSSWQLGWPSLNHSG